MNTPRLTAAVVSLALLGALAACADSASDAAPVATASTATSTSASAQETPAPSHNDADTSFAQLMTVHHEGAIEMAGLANTNAATQEVVDLGLAISEAQEPEIESMTWWLDAWGEDSAEHAAMDAGGAMDHAGMVMDGLSHEEAMLELTVLAGAEFDARFLELMVAHHEGAVVMAQEEVEGGLNEDAIALAEAIIAAQTAEIAVMQGMLATA